MPCGASRRRGRWHSAHALLCARRSRSGRLGVTVSRRPSRGGRAAPRCAACMPPVSGRAPRWLPSLRRHYERAACACHASRCISSVAPGCRAAAQGSAPAPLLGLAKPHAGGRHLSADHGSPSFSKLTREQQCLKWLKTVPAGEGLVCKRLSSFLRAADLPSSRGGSPAGRAFRLRYNRHPPTPLVSSFDPRSVPSPRLPVASLFCARVRVGRRFPHGLQPRLPRVWCFVSTHGPLARVDVFCVQ